MSGPRHDIRKALLELLDRALGPDIIVTDTNPREIDVPSVQILAVSELADDRGLSGKATWRVTTYETVIRAKGESIQDELDRIADAVEEAIPEELDLGGARPRVNYRAMTLELDSQGDERVGTMALTFDLSYATEG